jgi:6-phosphogluconolactonase
MRVHWKFLFETRRNPSMIGTAMNMIARLTFCAALALGCSPAFAAGNIAYVGTYTNAAAKGIYALKWEAASKKFVSLGLQAEVANPSFVAVSPSHKFLYAITERAARRDGTGSVSSYAIDPASGALKLINRVPAHGNTSAHLVVDASAKWLLVANYGSGSVASFALNADGSIGEMADFKQHAGSSVNPHRQMGPHPHEVVMSPDNRFLLVPDLGLDQVFVYGLDSATGKLTLASTTDTRPGFGPRHLLFGKGGKFIYVLGEMGSAVTVMSYSKGSGMLVPIQIIDTVPEHLTVENNSAELALSPDGRFLYASNRGHDSVTVFKIGGNGQLTLVQNIPSQGHIPRGMAIDSDGMHLLTGNQESNNIVIFDRDAKTGKLTPTGQVMTDIPAAVCILFTKLD